MEINFKTKNEKQLQGAEAWLDDTTEQILYGGGKYGGKSFLGVSLIFGDALIYPETQYFVARKSLTDLRKFTISSIQEVFKLWSLDISKYAPFNGQDNVFNLYNGSKVFLIPCDNLPSDPLFERFGSMQMTRGWLEEAGEIEESAKENLWLSVGRWKNDFYKLRKKLLITANPKKGWMKRDFVEPYKQGFLLPSKKYIQALAIDNVHGSPEYINSLRNEKDPIRRQRLWEGNWDYDEDKDSLIFFEALTDCFSNTITKDGQKYLVADIARLGRDRTVLSLWDGLELYQIEIYERQDTEKTKQQIKDYAAAHRIPFSNILVDEDGVGGGIVDSLFGIRGFTANSSPIPTNYEIREKEKKLQHSLVPKSNFRNLKSQCGFKLAEIINERRISFRTSTNRDIIIEELNSLLRKKNVDSDGRLELRSKDDVKIELGRSPDIGDAILMRMFFELKKESMNENTEITKEAFIRQEQMFLRNKDSMKQNSAE